MSDDHLTPATHLIDLSAFVEGDVDAKRATAHSIDVACRDSGFIVLVGHGVDPRLMSRSLDIWSEFFNLSADEKGCYALSNKTGSIGYSGLGTEAFAYSSGAATPPDLSEAFALARDDAVGPFYDQYRSWFPVNVWPESIDSIRRVTLELEAEFRRITTYLLEAMEMALDLPARWLQQRNERAVITLRAINYERAAGAPDPLPGQQRLGAHTDYGVMTLLVADPVPGLQIFRQGAWWDVIPEPGSIVCNVGDMLAMWTNDEWKSTVHRVIPPPKDAEGAFRRRSIARFLDCDPSERIECIPSCVHGDTPPRYPPVQAGEWLRAKIVSGWVKEVADLPFQGLTGSVEALRP